MNRLKIPKLLKIYRRLCWLLPVTFSFNIYSQTDLPQIPADFQSEINNIIKIAKGEEEEEKNPFINFINGESENNAPARMNRLESIINDSNGEVTKYLYGTKKSGNSEYQFFIVLKSNSLADFILITNSGYSDKIIGKWSAVSDNAIKITEPESNVSGQFTINSPANPFLPVTLSNLGDNAFPEQLVIKKMSSADPEVRKLYVN